MESGTVSTSSMPAVVLVTVSGALEVLGASEALEVVGASEAAGAALVDGTTVLSAAGAVDDETASEEVCGAEEASRTTGSRAVEAVEVGGFIDCACSRASCSS